MLGCALSTRHHRHHPGLPRQSQTLRSEEAFRLSGHGTVTGAGASQYSVTEWLVGGPNLSPTSQVFGEAPGISTFEDQMQGSFLKHLSQGHAESRETPGSPWVCFQALGTQVLTPLCCHSYTPQASTVSALQLFWGSNFWGGGRQNLGKTPGIPGSWTLTGCPETLGHVIKMETATRGQAGRSFGETSPAAAQSRVVD